ncbi:hypothetical protein E4P41_15740 [Geodermatophilus sp. DF01-2]|uniref:hypothetical protein n=1 Tax=Geodermatophilus sp. DF01-2 TaxID=2559610 RepID=UPI001073C1BC|nr:hypothetical protein [Geodermatophilus sp. DF01_2]TFV56451.1 hypothetical protein E4P41_15740 [Geodermatophilus sp. DF01_2]
MSTVVEPPSARPEERPATARTGSLLRAELHRFRARRFVQVIFGLAVLGALVETVVGLTSFGMPTEAELAAAQAEIDRMVVENEQFRRDCLANPPTDLPPDITVEEACGPPVTTADFDLGMFLSDPPFSLAQDAVPGVLGSAVAGAALAFLLGATWIGAEWSTRSLVSLLFWEPRRVRVMAVKLAVLVLGALVLAVGLQAAWLATVVVLDATAGDGRGVPDGFWGQLFGTQARGVLLTVLAAIGGFGLTSLVRNTGAALGIGFVYFAVVEIAAAVLRPAWQPWLLTSSAAGLLSPGGHIVFIFEETIDPATGSIVGETREVLVSNLQGGLVLGAVAVAAVVLGVVLFARRDVH